MIIKMIEVFCLIFIKELIGTITGKLYISGKDKIPSVTSAFKSLIDTMGNALILGVILDKILIANALCGFMAVLLASLGYMFFKGNYL